MNRLSRIAAGTAAASVIATAGLVGGTIQASAAPAPKTATVTQTSDPLLRYCAKNWVPKLCDKYRR